ncbi:GntR family transcriptional regulator [Brachybacterium saurashtrense]|uniref:GntR family transcriptional regulator n=1 Tax=Brachybacterium saurashtrense TaxID=556288 RepID=A0A345YR38_9MICO|nr:GntR family transcriptional regulator [Brachybacterium saurashtrense]AXK46390.1 GntR family transcriptional regulator [Brachybacterium saurashtrense]RRR24131.1 GntR family transcriptional regulator [Brachybacterium saurashtrense]
MTAAAAGSLAEQAYLALRDHLIMLEIAPGEPLQEGRIAEELGVGRTPVREAIKRLELDHLVVTYPRRGTFATAVDITALAAITQVRAALEPVAVRAASANRDPSARAALEEAARSLAALEGTPDGPAPRQALQVDVDVHRAIYRSCGNIYLAETLLRLDNLSTRIWCVAMHRLPGLTAHVTELREMLEATLAGDADRAAALISQHVAEFESSIRAVL